MPTNTSERGIAVVLVHHEDGGAFSSNAHILVPSLPSEDYEKKEKHEAAVVDYSKRQEPIDWNRLSLATLRKGQFGVVSGRVKTELGETPFEAADREKEQEVGFKGERSLYRALPGQGEIQVKQKRNGGPEAVYFYVQTVLYSITQLEIDQMMKFLAEQNRTLETLQWDKDVIVAPKGIEFRPLAHAVFQLLTKNDNPLVYA